MVTDVEVTRAGTEWSDVLTALNWGCFFSACYITLDVILKYNMKHKLTYKTSMHIDGNTLTDNHIIICSSWEHAKDIEYDLTNGDFGDIIAYDIDIEPIIEIDNDLPF